MIEFARPEWQEWARCRGEVDEAKWFPRPGQSADAAKATCTGCVVREQCLAYALGVGVRFGVWGGTTELERRRIRKQRRREEQKMEDETEAADDLIAQAHEIAAAEAKLYELDESWGPDPELRKKLRYATPDERAAAIEHFKVDPIAHYQCDDDGNITRE